MRLTDVQFEKLLPLFMRQEKDNLALARGLDPIIREIGERIKLCSDWGVIDELSEAFVDELAWELDIDWYNPKADRSFDVKKALVKSADEVHKHLGTKAAVERVASEIFGNGTVEEWFETGDAPGYFRVWVETVLNEDNVGRFMKTISQVKNARSHLKAVTCRFEGDMDDPEIDPGAVITEYGETDIYGQIRYLAELICSELESVSGALLKVRGELEAREEYDTRLSCYFGLENSEGINGALMERTDPCYFYNGLIRYDGNARYNSYYNEEDL